MKKTLSNGNLHVNVASIHIGPDINCDSVDTIQNSNKLICCYFHKKVNEMSKCDNFVLILLLELCWISDWKSHQFSVGYFF